ncbi:hypothetical protein ILUMI_04124 [Ignelater luminosus]|uniref:Uncharacterized protein n=1 Tax=Ignelater luminosus TaxID=2038154 RepID=A0A8K0DFC1_IGNLU|nr:hypothetical protein ILUMI_04124 [Ignelater luminosus]
MPPSIGRVMHLSGPNSILIPLENSSTAILYVEECLQAALFNPSACMIIVTYLYRVKLGKLLNKIEQEPYLVNTKRGGKTEEKLIKKWISYKNNQYLAVMMGAVICYTVPLAYTVVKRTTSTNPQDWIFAYGPITVLNIRAQFQENIRIECGPISPVTHNNKKHMLTFLDDFSHFIIVYLLENNTEVLKYFKECVEMIEAKFRHATKNETMEEKHVTKGRPRGIIEVEQKEPENIQDKENDSDETLVREQRTINRPIWLKDYECGDFECEFITVSEENLLHQEPETKNETFESDDKE